MTLSVIFIGSLFFASRPFLALISSWSLLYLIMLWMPLGVMAGLGGAVTAFYSSYFGRRIKSDRTRVAIVGAGGCVGSFLLLAALKPFLPIAGPWFVLPLISGAIIGIMLGWSYGLYSRKSGN
jgi:hypothetical protein